MKYLVLVARLVFGAWLLANGVNHFFLDLYPEPTGTGPLAVQLMQALVNSRLFDVAMAIQLAAGALILTGFFVPVALCVAMPISTCAVYWAAVLEREPVGALLALAAFALNGLLMLAYVDYYRGALQRTALALGEREGSGRNFDSLFVDPRGRTSRIVFVGALAVLLAVAAFYAYRVTGRTSQFCVAVLIFPALILHARRLHDMGRAAWPLVLPGVLLVATAWFFLYDPGSSLKTPVMWAAFAVSAGFVLWGLLGKGQADANRFGAPAPAS